MWSLSYVWKRTFFPVSIFIEKVIYFTNWYQGDLFSCLTSFTVLLLLCSFLSLGNQNHKSLAFVFHVLGPAIGIAFCPLRVAVLIPPPLFPLQTRRLEAIFLILIHFLTLMPLLWGALDCPLCFALSWVFWQFTLVFLFAVFMTSLPRVLQSSTPVLQLLCGCCCSHLPWELYLSFTTSSINSAMRGIRCIKELDRGNAR